MSTRVFPIVVTVFFLLLTIPGMGESAQDASGRHPAQLSYRPNDPLNAAAFDHFYNLDYDRAIQEFEQVVQRHPEDPFAVNHLLTAVLIRELYRMGALNTSDFVSNGFALTPHGTADPKAKQEIKSLVDRATTLEEKQLDANPNDVDALYARGVTRAQFSTYTALIEHAWFSALRNAVGARRDHERVLELSPGYTDAKLVVGTHNYVIGSLPWGVKVAVSMVRLGGSKDKGIEYLREAAAGNDETSIDAKILLALFLRREQEYPEALRTVQELEPRYPRNILLSLEEANLLRDEHKNAEAAALYRKLWQAGREGKYQGLHYEVAAFSLGNLLRSEKDYSGAAAAYENVAQTPNPDPETLQKADLGAGQMYDLLQKRELAVKKYEAVVAVNSATPSADTARKLMKEAYRQD